MNAPTPIGIAVVEHDGRYLVGTRAADVPLAGFAEFPGGKCRSGEDPADCAGRECLEETGIAVRAERLLLRRQFDYPHGLVDLHFWLCRLLNEADAAAVQGGFRWVPAAELSGLQFPEANAPVVRMLSEPGTQT